MFDLPTLVSFIVAAFVVTIVPGVTVSAIVSTSLARGLAAGFWLELGAQIGRLGMVIVVAVALEAVVGFVTFAFDFIKYVGAAYLLWMGVNYLTSRSTVEIDRVDDAGAPGRLVLSGIMVLWSNPKALLFFGAFLPQFVNPAYPAWPQVLVLGLIEMGAALITDGAYIVIAARARHLLAGRSARRVNQIAGALLIGAAVWLALQH
ncbi:LysE family translocator [Arsenicitalea aurantiaca]|uniref:LysE family translocator n=1 Tax=Arsenicitalea aurantiaca TaxID=1783274 RepID=A0A433XFJ8_9HYPH|nr:LysE family translocator [Arsenicitalea aurantiaca]RUT32842.1 LysE family translocator [Arsenicitalea aurantiaca]